MLKAINLAVPLCAAVFLLAVFSDSYSSSSAPLHRLSYIAHAGGAFNGDNYQNSIETLNQNYAKGFRFFELDFSWTSDLALVGIHDWDGTYRRLFEQSPAVPDLASFSGMVMKNGSTPITLNGLDHWLEKHPDAWVISDIKENNLEGLAWIGKNFPLVAQKMIPQIYAPGEYEVARQQGYPNIILTIYKLPDSAENSVLELAKSEKLLAVTMPEYWFSRRKLSDSLMGQGVPVCVHTINDPAQYTSLKAEGASCIYTDSLMPVKNKLVSP